MREYAAYMQDTLGLQVVPLYGPTFGPAGGRCTCRSGASCESPCKHPRSRYKDQPSRLPTGGDNYAVVLGRYVVLDVDDRSVLESLDDVLGFALPDTWAVDTGRGRHYWFVAEAPLRTRIGAWPKIDVKSGGTYVVGAGSVSVNGVVYEPVNTLPIAPCPAALVEAIGERRPTETGTIPAMPIRERTTPLAWYVVESWVDEMRHTTTRNQTLFNVACRMLRSGWVGQDGLVALGTAALETGLGFDEVERTIRSAERTCCNGTAAALAPAG